MNKNSKRERFIKNVFLNKSMKEKKFILPLMFFLGILFSVSFVLATYDLSVANVTAPASGTNSSGSLTLSCWFWNQSAKPFSPNASSILTNWSFEVAGAITPITVTGITCGNFSCNSTASASALTDGLGANITCSLGNDTLNIRGGANATKLDLYTSTPVCSFTVDREIVKYMDVIGIETSNASTKDPLSNIVMAWNLWRSDNTNVTTSSLSEPTFSETDFDQIDEFILGLTVRDKWFNYATCANKTITVMGRDGDETVGITTTKVEEILGTNRMLLFAGGGVLLLIIIATIVILMITKAKKGGRYS